MPRLCPGGKGNSGMFIERDPQICAAGVPTFQPGQYVSDCLKHYSLKNEADALIHDVIIPPLKCQPARKPLKVCMQNAGIYCESKNLLSPPPKTKFQSLAEDFKETIYGSYWKAPVGCLPDRTFMLPEGLDGSKTLFGKKLVRSERLYDLIMPVVPALEIKPNKMPSVQTDRNYCRPAFNPDTFFGHKTDKDTSGHKMKCLLTNDAVLMGTSLASPISSSDADFKFVKNPKLGISLAPNDNISCVPKGFTFGKPKPPANTTVYASMVTGEINPDRDFFRKCLGHLNTIRKGLSKRRGPCFFPNFCLNLKYYDKSSTGWLPKTIVYDYCATQHIRFDPTLLEPLLSIWKAFDGTNIDYKIFTRVINYRVPSPEIPKITDIPEDILEFRTTYSEMIKPDQKTDMRLRAGLPSGRYLDKDYPITPEHCCKAHHAYLPEESDMKSCLFPSILTTLGVTHRDMYGVRDPKTVRKVFEAAAGEKFTDEYFSDVWDEAKKYNSKDLVCFETFRKALGVVKFPEQSK